MLFQKTASGFPLPLRVASKLLSTSFTQSDTSHTSQPSATNALTAKKFCSTHWLTFTFVHAATGGEG